MTYEQIEKEFEKNLYSINNNGCADIPSAVGYFKQSFIKYLQSEVERLEKSKKVVIICSDTDIDNGIACRSCSEGYSSCDNAQTEFVYNQAISDQMKHLEAQIKELDTSNN